MSKKMTTPIARALAEKVRAKLQDAVTGMDTAVKEKIIASKEWKEMVKLSEEKRKIAEKMDVIEKSIEKKYTQGVLDVQVSIYNSGPELRVRENYNVASVDAIKDTILIEDYLSGGAETAETMIERITQQLLKP